MARVIQAAQGRFDDVRLRTNNPAAAACTKCSAFIATLGEASIRTSQDLRLWCRTSQCNGPRARVARLAAADRNVIRRCGRRAGRALQRPLVSEVITLHRVDGWRKIAAVPGQHRAVEA